MMMAGAVGGLLGGGCGSSGGGVGLGGFFHRGFALLAAGEVLSHFLGAGGAEVLRLPLRLCD